MNKRPDRLWQDLLRQRITDEAPRVSDDDLMRLHEGRLDEAERERILAALASSPEALAANALAAMSCEAGDAPGAAERAKALFESLPLAFLRLGVARQGIKVLSRKLVEVAPDRGRLRLAKVLPDASARGLVLPPDDGVFVAVRGALSASLSTRVRGYGLTATLRLSMANGSSAPARFDVLEDGQLVSSEAVRSGESVVLPDLRQGRMYTLAVASPVEMELSFRYEPVRFTLRDLVDLCLYYIADGNIKAALDLCRDELPQFGGPGKLGDKASSFIRCFVDLMPEMRFAMAQSAARREGVADGAGVAGIEAILRRYLASDAKGRWDAVLAESADGTTDWVRVQKELSIAAEQEPDNESLVVACDLLQAWLDTKGHRSPTLVALHAMRRTLERLVENEPADQAGSEGLDHV